MSNSFADDFSLDFPRALGPVCGKALFRRQCEDFEVDEILGFELSGEGEHLYLQICKVNENTRWVAHLLADHFGVDGSAVGYAGLKDRRAVTTQWFSVHIPKGQEPPVLPDMPGCQILSVTRHSRKLRPGAHGANRFVIRLGEVSGSRDGIEARLSTIAAGGVPNYFGEQRFGIGAGNLREVAAILARPSPRFRGKRGGLYLSAARSWLFNQVLAAHLKEGAWPDIVSANGASDGPLWGRGRNPAQPSLAAFEAGVLQPWQAWCHALEHSGLKQERRSLVLVPDAFSWRWQNADLVLSFSLPPGAFATAVLREVAVLIVPEPMV